MKLRARNSSRAINDSSDELSNKSCSSDFAPENIMRRSKRISTRKSLQVPDSNSSGWGSMSQPSPATRMKKRPPSRSLSQPSLSITSFFQDTDFSKTKIGRLLLSSDDDDLVSAKKPKTPKKRRPKQSRHTSTKKSKHSALFDNILELQLLEKEFEMSSTEELSEESDSGRDSPYVIGCRDCPLCGKPILGEFYEIFESFIAKLKGKDPANRRGARSSDAEVTHTRKMLTAVSSRRNFICSLHRQALNSYMWAEKRRACGEFVPPPVTELANQLPERLLNLQVLQYSEKVLKNLVPSTIRDTVLESLSRIGEKESRSSYVLFSTLSILPSCGYYGSLGRQAVQAFFDDNVDYSAVTVHSSFKVLPVADLYRFVIVPEILINLVALDNGLKQLLTKPVTSDWYEKAHDILDTSVCIFDKYYLQYLFENSTFN